MDRAHRPRSTENHLAFHHRQGAARLPLQPAKHYVVVEALDTTLLDSQIDFREFLHGL